MKKRYQRLGVMGLAAVMACTGTVLPVLAGQASVAVDENMYVNLDYYGNVDRVNVVKVVSYQESYHLSMFVIKNSFSRLIQKKELSLFWINKNKNHELIPHCIFVRNQQKRTSL